MQICLLFGCISFCSCSFTQSLLNGLGKYKMASEGSATCRILCMFKERIQYAIYRWLAKLAEQCYAATFNGVDGYF